MDIPPQYGPGFGDESEEGGARAWVAADGDDSWHLPLALSATDLEPLPDAMNPGEEAARHEAAYKLAANAEAIAVLRAVGWARRARSSTAPLADPTAVPNLKYEEEVGRALRATATLLLEGTAGKSEGETSEGGEGAATCLKYLRDRVGVPRDMSYPAAMQPERISLHYHRRRESSRLVEIAVGIVDCGIGIVF